MKPPRLPFRNLGAALMVLSVNLCIVASLAIGISLLSSFGSEKPLHIFPWAQPTPTSTPELLRPLDESGKTGGKTGGTTGGKLLLASGENLQRLKEAVSQNYLAAQNPSQVHRTAISGKTESKPTPGETRSFQVLNIQTRQHFTTQTVLRYQDNPLHFWVGTDVAYDSQALTALAKTITQTILPTNIKLFGSDQSSTPAIADVYIIYVRGLGATTAAFYAPHADAPYDRQNASTAHQETDHELIYLNADQINLTSEYTYAVLAHEIQHMLHAINDPDEETWLSEGFSELSAFINGYGTGNFAAEYAKEPDTSLTTWPGTEGNTTPHYGASFLFADYFFQRFGRDYMRVLVNHPAHGMDGIERVLMKLPVLDPSSARFVHADDVFGDWTVANYLDDPSLLDGRYGYKQYPGMPMPTFADKIAYCPTATRTTDVQQYGVDYIKITCFGRHSLQFEGSTQVKVLPLDPPSGKTFYWANRTLNPSASLERDFDFRAAKAPLTLVFKSWYDLEKDVDFVYVTACEDGKNWQNLKQGGVDLVISGTSAGKWKEGRADLSGYAGKKVTIRFTLESSTAASRDGFALDDVSILGTDYREDFEQ